METVDISAFLAAESESPTCSPRGHPCPSEQRFSLDTTGLPSVSTTTSCVPVEVAGCERHGVRGVLKCSSLSLVLPAVISADYRIARVKVSRRLAYCNALIGKTGTIFCRLSTD